MLKHEDQATNAVIMPLSRLSIMEGFYSRIPHFSVIF